MHSARNTFIVVFIAFLISLGGYIFIFTEVRSAGKESTIIEQRIEQEHEKTKKRDAVRTMLESTEADRMELESRLVTENTLVNFFEDMEGLSDAAKVKMEIAGIVEKVELDPVLPKSTEEGEENKPTKNPASGLLEWLQLEINATGSWSEVYRFLTLVELLPYETTLSNVRFEMNTKATEQIITNEDGEEVSVPAPTTDSWKISFTLKVLELKTQ